jgi:branched-subunit amino acid ABC-type transport system permease component
MYPEAEMARRITRFVAAALAVTTITAPASAAPRPAVRDGDARVGADVIVDRDGRPVDAATLTRLGYRSGTVPIDVAAYTLPTGVWEWSSFGVVTLPPEAAISSFLYNADNPTGDFILTFTTTGTLTRGYCDNSPLFAIDGLPDGAHGLHPFDVGGGTMFVGGVTCTGVTPTFPLAEWAVTVSGYEAAALNGTLHFAGAFGGTFSH